MYNLNYAPTTLGVQIWREIICGGTRTKKVEYRWVRTIGEFFNIKAGSSYSGVCALKG
jgi:hypothetical protein